ncbi:MAG: hypothetical protein IIC85_10560 [Chloroflexi bacterium]|nr:hypothetical protein [Chloroflexota bacterium]
MTKWRTIGFVLTLVFIFALACSSQPAAPSGPAPTAVVIEKEVIREVGINLTNKLTLSLLKRLPGHILMKVNRLVGFRLLTKFGARGAINLHKVIPVLGAFTSAGVNVYFTNGVGNAAIQWFQSDPSSLAS